MCGICGIVNLDPHRPVDRDVLERMRDVMAYRGPDGAGLLIDKSTGLGHRRLSIIDLSPTGHQPMTNQDGSLWIIFNGEVYNYLELRSMYLEGRHRFAGSSDTEVILHLYEEFGEDCVQHLNGMFAFAIWDCTQRQLFLARDRLGVKPLYYAQSNGAFLFASEIKAILQHDDVRVSVRPTAIDEFMTFGYVQGPGTIFEGIHRLPPGHTLTWRRGTATVRRYWDLTFKPNEALGLHQHTERLVALLEDSIRLRLRSDVPLGILLSGGLDSTTVAALMARSVGKIKTFSIGFDAGRDFNELEYARLVARRFATDHHEMILAPTVLRDFVPRFVYHMDEPVTEAAAISLYFVSALAAQHVKVALSGEGSDELFAGYPIYRYMGVMERFRRLPLAVRKAVVSTLRLASRNQKLDKYLFLAELPLDRRYLNVHLYDPRVKAILYSRAFQTALDGFDALASLRGIYSRTQKLDLLSRLLYLDTTTWLPDDLLIKADRMSMATSIELRVPFLDYRLVEYAATIPSRYKLRAGKGKFILKHAVKELLPREILDRRKMGFPAPLAEMFRGELSLYVQELLTDRRAIERGYFEARVVGKLLEEHRLQAADHHSILWRLAILEEWHRQFLDAPSQPRESAPVAVGA